MIPPGTYALSVIHDENMNEKLGTNWLGIPKEGYGFSNDVKALLGAPSISAASLSMTGNPGSDDQLALLSVRWLNTEDLFQSSTPIQSCCA